MLLVNLLAIILYHSIVTNSVNAKASNRLTVLTIQCIDSNCDKLQMNISLNGRPSSFDLFENVDLFTSTYKASLASTDRTLSDSLQSTRYYITSRNDGQWASLSGNDGQFEGLLSIDSEQYDLKFDALTSNHYAIAVAQLPEKTYEAKCGFKDDSTNNRTPDPKPRMYIPVRPTSENYYVELVLVNDYRMYSHHFNKSLSRLLQFNYRLINGVNALFAGLGVHVSLKAIETWTTAERVNGTDLESNMRALQVYSAENYLEKYQYDAIFGLVGTNYPRDSDGYAFGIALMGLCTQYATGVAMYEDEDKTVFPFRDLVLVTTHEIGHIMGLVHIGRAQTQCRCPGNANGFCIMDEFKVVTTSWSVCSKTIIKDRADSFENWCIFEKPEMYKPMPIAPICGNGIVERGETCDCGIDVACRQCCDVTTCKMFVGSNYTCTSGSCCANCNYRQAGVPCQSERPGIDQVCTVGSTCTGSTPSCPDSSVHVDGTACQSVAGVASYCHNGQCNSRNDQCRAVFGTTTTAGTCPDSDYAINVLGVDVGHCGEIPLRSKSYVKCAQTDILCGQLKCLVTRANEDAASDKALLLGETQLFISELPDAQLNHCFSVNYHATTRGLVTDGAVCGVDRVCFNQKCVPTTVCPGNCNGNGVCLNGRKCLCNTGFLEPYCYPACPENCRNRGVCRKDGTCDCAEGFYPPTCTIKMASPSSSDSNASSYVIAAAVVFVLTVLVLVVYGIIRYRKENDDQLVARYKRMA